MEPDNMLNIPNFRLHLFVKLAFVEEMDTTIIRPAPLPVNSQHKSRSLPEPAQHTFFVFMNRLEIFKMIHAA